MKKFKHHAWFSQHLDCGHDVYQGDWYQSKYHTQCLRCSEGNRDGWVDRLSLWVAYPLIAILTKIVPPMK